MQSLKEEYFREDTKRATKRSFLVWIASANKGLSINELLREFECQDMQLFGIEKLILEFKKTEFVMQAVDPLLQKKLEPLLEDWKKRSLKTDWKEVESIVSLLIEKLGRRDKTIGSIPSFHPPIPIY
jgi:hypothetical protein